MSEAADELSPRERWAWWGLGTLLLALVYGPCLRAGYALDDTPTLLLNPVVQGEVPWWEAFAREFRGRPLGEKWSSSYRPLAVISFAWVRALDPAAGLQHALNLVLYALLIGQFYLFARRWLRGRVRLAATLAFALMPSHVESVAAIVGRADLMAVSLALLSVELALPHPWGEQVPPSTQPPPPPRAGPIAQLAACLLFWAAMLSKEVVALLPGLVIWMSVARADLALLGKERLKSSELRRRLPAAVGPGLPLAAAGVAYILFRQELSPVGLPEGFIGADNQIVDLDPVGAVLGRFTALGHYLPLFVWPLSLCADHTYADVWLAPGWSGLWRSPAAAFTWFGLAMSAGGLWTLVAALRAPRRAVLELWLLFTLSMLLLGHFATLLSVIVAERVMLWPSLFFCLALAAMWPKRVPRGLRPLVAIIFILWAALSGIRAREWHDSVSLFRSSAQRCPAAVHNRLNLAVALRDAGQGEEAVWNFALAAAGRRAYPKPWHSQAFVAEETLSLQERLPRLPELLGIEPTVLWPNLHRFLLQQNSPVEAAIVESLARGRYAGAGPGGGKQVSSVD